MRMRRGSPLENYWIILENSCWEWQGSKCKRGYGRYRVGSTIKQAHRVVYEKYKKKKIESGLELDHKCRNRACVNPDHVEELTHLENVLVGETTKLKEFEVKLIRDLWEHGKVSQGELAIKFKVSQSNISDIITRKTWRNI